VQPDAEAAGATWVQHAPVVVDRNLATSAHPRHAAAFSAAIVAALRGK
jgi:putative intracellular protease/amidase